MAAPPTLSSMMAGPLVSTAFVFNRDRTQLRVFFPNTVPLLTAQHSASNFRRYLGMKSTLFENPRDRYWCITLSNDIAETVIGTHYGAVPEDLPGVEHEEGEEYHIPRPANSWILYRQHHSRLINQATPGQLAGDVSIMVAEMWRNEPDSVRDQWKEKAAEARRKHELLFPNYKYTPRKNDAKKSGKGSKKDDPKTKLLEFVKKADKQDLKMLVR